MRRNLLFKNLGVAVAVAAFAFIACDDSSSGPVVPDAITSSETNGLPGSSNSNPVSSSDVDGSSSSVMVQCNAFMPECGYSPEELCAMGMTQYCTGSSSSMVNPESSSAVNSRNSSSSNSGETCIHMSDMPANSDSDPWCFGDEGKHAEDCFTHEAYTCTDGFWVKDADMCIHISDSESANRWDCDAPDYTLKADCANSDSLYMCAAGMWIAAKDCDITQERCGYSDADLCMYFGIIKYCSGSPRVLPDAVPCNQDGKSVVIEGQWMYRCDNGRWHIVVPMGG